MRKLEIDDSLRTEPALLGNFEHSRVEEWIQGNLEWITQKWFTTKFKETQIDNVEQKNLDPFYTDTIF